MRFTFRKRLLILVGAAGLSLCLLTVIDAFTASAEEEQLDRIEARYVPLLELGPQLDALMERMRRSFQDAAAAADPVQLRSARRTYEELVHKLRSARQVLAPEDVTMLLVRLDRYYGTAGALTERLIAGETGEDLIDAMADMQMRQKQLAAALTSATRFDRAQLERAFGVLRHQRIRSVTLRLGVSLVCLLLVLGISGSVGAHVLRALDELATGFARFGRNELREPIRLRSDDELGDVARSANEMAANLYELSNLRDRQGWLASGQAELAKLLEGELDEAQIATRSIRFLARQTGAAIGALFTRDERGKFVLLGEHAASRSGTGPLVAEREGLLGLAAESDGVLELTELPKGAFTLRTGLGEIAPSALWAVPIVHAGSVIAVAELGFVNTPELTAKQLLGSVRDTIGVVLHAAGARAAKQRLLLATEAQAQQLREQEEELRAVNEELTAQQEELRAANEELTHQTEELEAQQHSLFERNQELEAARTHLQEQAARLESLGRYKSQFLANMSHELRTPLNSMLLLSELLARNESESLDEKQVEFASTIHAAGKDLLSLINQILDLAKVESGKMEAQLAFLPVREVVSHLARLCRPLAQSKNLAFEFFVDSAVPDTMFSDRARIEQILTNLIGNAIKFTEQGQVSLRVERPGPGPALLTDVPRERTILFQVTDTGLGIARENQERVFQAFEQVDGGSQRRHGGTGLGLAIARELAQMLGGELTVESELKRGSTFSLILPDALARRGSLATPLEEEATGTNGKNGQPARPSPANKQPGTPGSVLIIEDDLIFAERVADLASEQGLRSILAKDGQSGLRLARVHKPSGIVLDVRLPDIDGFRVLEALQAHEETRDIPVHFVSCVDDEGRGVAQGALGYLRKPTTRDGIMRALSALVPASGQQRKVLVVEDDQTLCGSLLEVFSREKIEGHCVNSGEAAYAALREQPYACMILDLGLPDIDGLEILARLQTDDTIARIPVIVHTGRALSRTEAQRLEGYAESVVLKGSGSVERIMAELRLFLDQVGRTPQVHARPSALADGKLQGRKVLVADDDMRTVYALSALLRSRGVDVLTADNGRSAVDMLGSTPEVDAVIMDIMMPEMDGYEAISTIRKDPRFQRTPIIALTAKAMKEDRLHCIEIGASDYMPKPIDGERLVSLLQAWLSTGSEA
jgi:signal transduction histidine kinase/CheY-like chemotaxis protein